MNDARAILEGLDTLEKRQQYEAEHGGGSFGRLVQEAGGTIPPMKWPAKEKPKRSGMTQAQRLDFIKEYGSAAYLSLPQ